MFILLLAPCASTKISDYPVDTRTRFMTTNMKTAYLQMKSLRN